MFANLRMPLKGIILGGDEIGAESLPAKLRAKLGQSALSQSSKPTLDDVEKRYVLEILEGEDGDKSRAARTLGIDLSTLTKAKTLRRDVRSFGGKLDDDVVGASMRIIRPAA